MEILVFLIPILGGIVIFIMILSGGEKCPKGKRPFKNHKYKYSHTETNIYDKCGDDWGSRKWALDNLGTTHVDIPYDKCQYCGKLSKGTVHF